MSAGAAAHGHTRKHSGTKKHHQHTKKHHPTHHHIAHHHQKHHVHAKAHHVKHAKARGHALAPWLLPVCGAEALAMSLRLAGQPVSDDEVAWLWELSGGGADGASIAATLDAAAWFGLAGCRLQFPRIADYLSGDVPLAGAAYGPRALPLHLAAGLFPRRGDHDVVHEDAGQLLRDLGHLQLVANAVEVLAVERHRDDVVAVSDRLGVHEELRVPGSRDEPLDGPGFLVAQEAGDVHVPVAHALILGVSSPGPHCVLATPDGWWSWGELYDPWDAVIEEAWLIGWEESPALGAKSPFSPPAVRAREHTTLSVGAVSRDG